MTNLLLPPPLVPAVFISPAQLAAQQAQVEVIHHQEAVAAAQAAADALAAQQAAVPVQTAYAGPSDALAYARGLVSPDQWQCLYNLWERESGWNDYAVNPYSGAAGIAQSLGHGYVQLGDYVGQINWGLGYIAQSYGSPCGAWSHSQNYGWY